jgi:hypothetical protein
MSRPTNDTPEPLLAEGATDFERRLLDAARREKPSATDSARMAKALGLAAGAVTLAAPIAAADALAAKAAAAKVAATTAGATTVWPWVSVTLVGLAVAGAVMATRPSSPVPHPAPPSASVAAPVRSPVTVPPPEAPVDTVVPDQRRHTAPATDLSGQIALLDAARAAMAAGAGRRALETLRRYDERYPGGSFRPEVAALRVEALVKLGRDAEARVLAERFVAEHPGSLLAKRVAALASLADQGH